MTPFHRMLMALAVIFYVIAFVLLLWPEMGNFK